MTDPKWKIESISVAGNAIFGDNAEMQVYQSTFGTQPLNHPAEADVKRAIAALQARVDSKPDEGEPSLDSSEREELTAKLKEVVAELQKNRGQQSQGRLEACMKAITTIAKPLPGLLKIAVQLKAVLGL